MHSALNKIKLIVKDKIGLDSSTIGGSTIDKIIQQRMHQCKAASYEDYYALVKNNQKELSELLEVTVIPETWFFRDIKPFEIIYKKIQQQQIENPSTIFRILSIPSSTGEEPYSLAMYLTEKGIDPARFSIDAVDISTRALKCAEKGLYGKNSFRGKDFPSYQKKYFEKEDEYYVIHSNIRSIVKFYRLNILHEEHVLHNQFDYILCRNLLIYFDSTTKLIAFNNLFKFMKDNGYLFIGHSEFGSVPDELFANTGFEHAFALTKHSNPNNDKKETTYIPETELDVNKKQESLIEPIKLKSNFESLIKKDDNLDIEKESSENTLKHIRKLADTGNYEKAESMCELFMQNNGEDTESLFLLGLIKNSQKKNNEAVILFRKGLFLDPKHYESLIHLSLILQKMGDRKNADLLKKRADKSQLNNEKI